LLAESGKKERKDIGARGTNVEKKPRTPSKSKKKTQGRCQLLATKKGGPFEKVWIIGGRRTATDSAKKLNANLKTGNAPKGHVNRTGVKNAVSNIAKRRGEGPDKLRAKREEPAQTNKHK